MSAAVSLVWVTRIDLLMAVHGMLLVIPVTPNETTEASLPSSLYLQNDVVIEKDYLSTVL